MSVPEQAPAMTQAPLATVYAMRSWYTTVLAQTRQVGSDLDVRRAQIEAELESIDAQLDHTQQSYKALERVLETIDDWIRKLTPEEGTFAVSEPGSDGGKPKRAGRSSSGTRPAASSRRTRQRGATAKRAKEGSAADNA
jgi:hypothetical protein